METATTAPDFAVIKAGQQTTWSSGDYAAVARLVQSLSEQMVDAAGLHPDWSVLDVAGGSGNAAIAAARIGCAVVCTDYVPTLLERARARAEAEQLALEIREADAEALPFESESFDAVMSAIGVMFTADHATAASELVRVCRRGGTIALASWTPDSFVGDMFKAVGAHVPPPAGALSPSRWGSEDVLGLLFGEDVRWRSHERHVHTFRFRSPEHFVDFFREHYGPTNKAFARLDGAGAEALHADLVEVARRHDRGGPDGSVAISAAYLVSIAERV